MTDSSLLSSELELQQQEDLYQQLLLQTMVNLQTETQDSKVIRPQPDVLRAKQGEGLYQHLPVKLSPTPPELSRVELVELLQSEDPTGYRVPMSLGEPHIELDNNSQGCTAYDVVINQDFFQRCQKDPLFQQFVILVSVEGLENKYSLQLNRDWKVLKNRKFLGSVTEQNIRTKSRPVIQELQPPCVTHPAHISLRENSAACAKRPEFSLFVEPPTGNPEYLIAEIKLPGVSSSRSLVLDVGEDQLVLTARPSLYHLNIFHPFFVDQEKSVAQYNKSTQILTITMPVVSSPS